MTHCVIVLSTRWALPWMDTLPQGDRTVRVSGNLGFGYGTEPYSSNMPHGELLWTPSHPKEFPALGGNRFLKEIARVPASMHTSVLLHELWAAPA